MKKFYFSSLPSTFDMWVKLCGQCSNSTLVQKYTFPHYRKSKGAPGKTMLNIEVTR